MKALIIALLIVATAAHAAPTFTRKPTVVTKGAGATISFAASENMDVGGSSPLARSTARK